MKIHWFDDNVAMWWKEVTLMKPHGSDENSLMKWTIINVTKNQTVMKVYHCDENLWIWWSQWWYFINGLKLIIAMKIHQLDDNSSTRWKFLTVIKILNWCDDSWIWLKLTNLMKLVTKINQGDENLARWLISIMAMKTSHSNEMFWW